MTKQHNFNKFLKWEVDAQVIIYCDLVSLRPTLYYFDNIKISKKIPIKKHIIFKNATPPNTLPVYSNNLDHATTSVSHH